LTTAGWLSYHPAVTGASTAFGKYTDSANTGYVYGFGAQEGDQTEPSTCLVLMGHRFYDPSTGRFINRDPADYGGGINLDNFTTNDPADEMDPEGFVGLDNAGNGIVGFGNAISGGMAQKLSDFLGEAAHWHGI
jgi:RHS repeat-associated protein